MDKHLHIPTAEELTNTSGGLSAAAIFSASSFVVSTLLLLTSSSYLSFHLNISRANVAFK
jgi:hypothetical protein